MIGERGVVFVALTELARLLALFYFYFWKCEYDGRGEGRVS